MPVADTKAAWPHMAMVLKAKTGPHSPADQKEFSASDTHPKSGILDVQLKALLTSSGVYVLQV